MANKRKSVVVYTALAVVIGTATIVGVLALTGKVNLRIRADEAMPADNAIPPFDAPHKQWMLRANPCDSAAGANAISDILGGKYVAYFDNSGSWVGGAGGQGITYGDATLKRGYAYWVYNQRTDDNIMWWVDSKCSTSNESAYSLTLPTGKGMAIGSPYLTANTSLDNIKVSFNGTDQGSLKALLASQAEGGANVASKKVKLIFYDRSLPGDNKYAGYETLTGIAGGPLEANGTDGDAVIKPGQAFYIAFAPSIGTEVKLEFSPL